MSRPMPFIEALVRQAFGLLLEIRATRNARRSLTLAVAFLETLVRDTHTETPPVVVSVQAVRIRKLKADCGESP